MSARLAFALACGLAVAGAALLSFATAWGIGLSPDPVSYVSMARDFTQGRIFGWSRDMAHFPPLYSIVLALVGVGTDPLAVARGIQIVLFAGNVMLVALLAWLAGGRRPIALPLGALVAATSITLLKVHAQAWSEPLFLMLTFGGLAMLATHLDTPSPVGLLGACGLGGAAILTRYAGLPLVPTGTFAISRWSKRPGGTRAQEAALYALTALLPLGGWLLKNLVAAPSSRPADRAIAFHPIEVARLRAGLDTVTSWCVAPDWMSANARLATLVLLVGMVGWASRRPRGGETDTNSVSGLPRLLGTFTALYLAFVLATITFVSADTPLDDRILAPVGMTAMVLLVSTVVRTTGTVRALVGGVFLLVVVTNAAQTWPYAREAHANGIGYASRRYVTSRLVDYVRHLPHGTVVVSNAARILYIRTGRHVRSLPAKYNPSSLAVNETFASDLAKLQTEALKTPLVIVYFDKRRHDYIPTPDEIHAYVSLIRVKTFRREGTVYALGAASPSAPPTP